MKISKIMHIMSVLVGFTGVVLFIAAMIGGGDNLVFGVTKFDVLICVAITILIAIWLQIATVHHMMLEKKGETV